MDEALKRINENKISKEYWLNLSYLNLTKIPDEITDLTHLEILNMNNNLITSIPSGIFDNLTNLQEISFSLNKIQSVPPNLFDKLDKLHWLSFHCNNLKTLPYELFINNSNLKAFYISGNEIQYLPKLPKKLIYLRTTMSEQWILNTIHLKDKVLEELVYCPDNIFLDNNEKVGGCKFYDTWEHFNNTSKSLSK